MRSWRLLPAAALLAGSTGCAQPEEFSSELQAPEAGSRTRGDVELPDGRRVAVYSTDGRTYVEQHYHPARRGWTAPEVLFDAQTRCGGPVDLVARGGSVAGHVSCPSRASDPALGYAVASGNLRGWDVAGVGAIAGTNALSANGRHAVYWQRSGDGYDVYRWQQGTGFDHLTMDPPAPDPAAALDVVQTGRTFPESPMPFGTAWFADNDGGIVSVDVRAWEGGTADDPALDECWVEVFTAEPGGDSFRREFAGRADVLDYCGANTVRRTATGGFRVHVTQVPENRSRDYDLVRHGDEWSMVPAVNGGG